MNAGVLVLLSLLAQAPPPSPLPDLLAREPAAGGVVWRQDVPELRLASATASNGARVHAMTMKGGSEAFATVVLPGSELRETDANRGISAAAAVALAEPSSARVPPATLQAYLAGKTIALTGQAEPDALVLRLRTAPTDFEPALRLAHLVLTEGRLDPERFRRWQTEAAARARADQNDPARRLEQSTLAALMKEDPRLRPPSPEAIARLTAPAAAAWLDAHLRDGPLEVTLVADVPTDDLLALGLKYFGSLPRRRLKDSALVGRQPVAGTGRVQVPIEVRGISAAQVRVAWRIPADVDFGGIRALAVAARVLGRRLMTDLHDKRHLVASASDVETAVVAAPARRAERWIGVTVRSDPAHADEAATAARTAVEQLARSGPTAVELAAAQKQLQIETRQAYATGRHWAERLAGFDYRAAQRSEPGPSVDERADLARAARGAERFSRQQVLDLLRRCVVDDGRLQIVVSGTH